MELRLAVRQYLNRHGVSAYRLVQATRGRLAERTVYALARGEARRVDLDTLGAVMVALGDLTGEAVSPNDLFEVVPDPPPVAPEAPAERDEERRGWMDSDLSRLGEVEPYDWGELDPTTAGEPVRYEPGRGLVVEGGEGG